MVNRNAFFPSLQRPRILAICALVAAAQVDTTLAVDEEMTVRGRSVSPISARFAGAPFPQKLVTVPGLQLVPQGGTFAQQDITVRGSSFSGAGLSLGGLALRNPQTEHFHAELPLPGYLLTSPRVRTGTDQTLQSTGHLVGSVSVDLESIRPVHLVSTGIGERGGNWQQFVYEDRFPRHPEWGAGVFGSRENLAGTAQSDNYLDRELAGFRLGRHTYEQRLDMVVARQRKDFGARGFYGTPHHFPSEESLTDTFFYASARRQKPGASSSFVRASALWRQIQDEYILDRTNPGLYLNRHRSTVFSSAVDGNRPFGAGAGVRWRLDAEEEEIDSTAFGDHRRRRAGLLLFPHVNRGRWELGLGGRAVWFSDDETRWLGLAAVRLALGESDSLEVDVVQTVREPSYTELYYRSISSIGNPNLSLQHTNALELSWRHRFTDRIGLKTSIFHRRSRHTVDWVKTGPGGRWLAVDRGTLKTDGAELALEVQQKVYDIKAQYCYLAQRSEHSFYASRYALNSPRHRFSLSGAWRLSNRWQVYVAQSVFEYRDNPLRESGSTGAESVAGVVYRPHLGTGLAFTLDVRNAWNDRFEYYPGQRSAGRRIRASVKYAW